MFCIFIQDSCTIIILWWCFINYRVLKMVSKLALVGSVLSLQSGVEALEAEWSEVTPDAAWSPRDSTSCVVFNDNMWVMGGDDFSGNYNEVWSSPDGAA